MATELITIALWGREFTIPLEAVSDSVFSGWLSRSTSGHYYVFNSDNTVSSAVRRVVLSAIVNKIQELSVNQEEINFLAINFSQWLSAQPRIGGAHQRTLPEYDFESDVA